MNRTRRAALALTLSLISIRASAAPLALPTPVTGPGVLSFGGALWQGIDDHGGLDVLGYGVQSSFFVNDARLVSTGQFDAYDGFHLFAVDGVHYSSNGADLTGSTISSVSRNNLSGLNVSLQYYFDPATPTIRVLSTFQNPTPASITAAIRYGGELGSDFLTTVDATSSGDQTISAADRWSITSDGIPFDPVNTVVYSGPGNPLLTPDSVSLLSGVGRSNVDRIHADYTLTVDPFSTSRLMWFGSLSPTVAAARSGANVFDSNSSLQAAGLLAGLSNSELASIANWDFPSQTSTAPEPSSLALCLLGTIALIAFPRKQKNH